MGPSRKEYRAYVRDVARQAISLPPLGRGHFISETVDASDWVADRRHAILALSYCTPGHVEEYLEHGDGVDSCETAAYWAIRADVVKAAESIDGAGAE